MRRSIVSAPLHAQRGLGIAAALMDALETCAVREGYRAIYLDTFDDLADAVRFYERRGYERIARYNDNPQATIFMRRALGAERRRAAQPG